MPLQLNELMRQVHQRINQEVMNEFLNIIVSSCNNNKIKLWGRGSGRLFIKKVLYLSFYHDVFNYGYTSLSNQLSNNIYFPPSSINHNTKVIRKELFEKIKNKIKIGDSIKWDRVANGVSKSTELESVNLWIDSCDFQIAGKRRYSTKDLMWS